VGSFNLVGDQRIWLAGLVSQDGEMPSVKSGDLGPGIGVCQVGK
jgi:hypothetical protein